MGELRRRPTVIFVANRSFALTSSRLPLLRKLRTDGWSVIAAVGVDDYTPLLQDAGIVIEPLVFDRGGLSPLADAKAFIRLVRLYYKYQPQLIHHFHAKPVIFGNFAAFFARKAEVVNNIEGLGYAFSSKGYVRRLASIGYRLALGRSSVTVFLNPDDQELFLQNSWILPEKGKLITSPGVDTSRYHPASERSDGCQRVLFVARLLWQKGVREFVEAAAIAKRRLPDAHFLLAGEWDDVHPDAVDRNYVRQSVANGTVEFLGYLSDMEYQLQKTDIFVLPSYYREGVPRVLLEAASSGVPVVTTDVPGCREAVINGKTGRIVLPRDAQGLAEAIVDILANPKLKESMGTAARQFVENNFDTEVITKHYLKMYCELGLDIDI